MSDLLPLLKELDEFLEGLQDTRDGGDGRPLPNTAMLLRRDVLAAIDKLEATCESL